MFRRIYIGLAVLCLIGAAQVGRPLAAEAANPFRDIADSQFKSAIEWAYNNGITAGCAADRYCPKGLVTREQMATFLVRMFGLPPATTDHFTDDNASKHEASINRLAEAGITAGCEANRFCPKGLVTREQMATFIARAAGLSAGAGNDYFWDDNGRSHEDNIDRMAAAGMTSGCASYRFCPGGSVTREQMAAFLRRVVAPNAAPPHPAPPPPTPAPSGCHPSYQGYCVRMGIGDWDCAGGSGNGPNYVPVRVRVVGFDEYDLDHNSDGYGCDSLG